MTITRPSPERPGDSTLSRLLHRADVLHLARIDRAIENLNNIAALARFRKSRTADFRRDLVRQ